MKNVCREGLCTGCMACSAVCPVGAININESIVCYSAEIDEKKCINCGKCVKTCQVNHPVQLDPPLYWKQGWARDMTVRSCSSSGGVASAVMHAFIKHQGVVYACAFDKGEFRYIRVSTVEDISKVRGSKYVKSNPIDIYRLLKKDLQSEKKVLFIGLPCHIAGMKNYLGKRLCENLYTIDLICHGTPSHLVLKDFLINLGIDIGELEDVRFRIKDLMGDYFEYQPIYELGVRDEYMVSFLNGLSYTENCYSCVYAQINRVADISLGDAWGSDLAYEERNKGISLVLVQTEKGKQILAEAEVDLFDIDIEKARAANHQLNHPTSRPKERDLFLNGLKNKKRVKTTIWRCFPKQMLKQSIKKFLIKMKLRQKRAEIDFLILINPKKR